MTNVHVAAPRQYLCSMYSGISGLENIFKAARAIRPLIEIIVLRPKIDSLRETGTKLEEMEGHVEFQNVTFAYPSRPDVKILDNVSFKVRGKSPPWAND